MKKRLFGALFVMCMTLTMLPATALAASTNLSSPEITVDQTEKPTLYKVYVTEANSDSKGGAPFREVEDGKIIGSIRSGTVLETLSYNTGGYAKVKWNGGEVYVWADKLKKVDAPDAVCSLWAQEWLANADQEYVGIKSQWPGAANDYTRTLTRGEMADLLVGILEEYYSTWSVQFTLPIVTGDDGEYHDLSSKIGFRPGRLVYWGVADISYFKDNMDKAVTYGEMTSYLMKLMAYEEILHTEGGGKGRTAFTQNDLNAFGIGGDTSASATCTFEQARVMCGEAGNWLEAIAEAARPAK